MSIADAMTALAPNLWYKLDEGSGTVAHNSGSLANDGTYSGAIDLTVDGVESGSKALRLYAGGQCVSLGMDVTTFHDMSIMCWISNDASGATSTIYPVISIGDVTNRLTRGVILYENHSLVGTPQWLARWNTSTATGASPGQPVRGWHHLAVTWTVSDNTMRVFLDGTQVNQNNPATKIAALSTDPLLIRSDEPTVIAHVGYWGRALALSEIQSVANQMAAWPYGTPINTAPTTGGGGGGLTSDQAAQLTDIQTKVADIPGITDAVNFISDTVNHIKGVTDDTATKVGQIATDVGNIVNTLLPQLANVLNDIGAQVTQILGGIMTKITTSAGSVLQTIGDFFSKHSADVFGLSNATGGATCERVDLDVSNSHFWGVMVHITTRPPMYWPVSPDKDWTYPDMAVITIQRGGFDIFRKPVHGTWETISPLPEALPEGVAGIAVPLLPQNYHIIVDWGFGVCGEVLLQYIP